jgi:hypothetical protein
MMNVSNNMLAALVIVAMAVSLAGTMSMLSVIPGVPSAITGMQTTAQTGIANATLASEVHIQLIVPTVYFGTIAKSAYKDTTNFSIGPHPFVLRNNGSLVINVSIGESTGTGSGSFWVQDDTCETCFQYNSTPNGTSGALAYWTWTSFSGTAEASLASNLNATPQANLVWNLTNSATGNARDVDIHLNITPPASELGGYKEGTIYFLAAQG